jgi:ADP-heptose:LPS heptosyltransferase
LIEKPFFLSGENMELLLAHLANTNLIISPNTNFYHIAGLVDTPRIGIFMEDEHPYFFKAPGSNAVFVKKFRSLPYDEITDEIAKLARGKGEKTEERKTEKG